MGESTFDDKDIRLLYREPLEGFIAARDQMVKELRTAGRAADASVVKALRKPSVPAWALNQLAERDTEGVEMLLDTGAEVRAAQQAALSSDGKAERLREATAARRQVVTRLTTLAGQILLETGRSPTPAMNDIRSTLDAASVDPDAGERLRAGTLDRTIREPVGFGDVFGLRSVPGGTGSPDEDNVEARQGKDRSVSTADLARLRRDRDAAFKKVSSTRETAGRLSAEVESMESRLEVLRAKLSAAKEASLAAESEAKRADGAIRDASGSTEPGGTR